MAKEKWALPIEWLGLGGGRGGEREKRGGEGGGSINGPADLFVGSGS